MRKNLLLFWHITSYTYFIGQRKKGWKKSICSANVSVKELSKANFILLSANRDHPNRPAVLTCRAEGSGRNSASSPKIKSGGSSGYWALKMISPEIKENVSPSYFLANV